MENVEAVAPPAFGLLAAAYVIAGALLMLSKGGYAKWGLIGASPSYLRSCRWACEPWATRSWRWP